MTINLSLTPETEVKLRDRAAATGKDLSTLIREAVEEKFSGTDENSHAVGLTYDGWSAQFSAWMNDVAKRSSAYPTGYVADSRQSNYEGRGE
jgi:hypothetical protein